MKASSSSPSDRKEVLQYKIHTANLTPRASGHVERFSDWMVKDMVTGECYRADHLVEETLEKLLADPKLATEKAAEYRQVIRQVCVCVYVCMCILLTAVTTDLCSLTPDPRLSRMANRSWQRSW